MYVVTPGDLLVLPGSNQIGPSTWAMLTSRPSADVSSINLFISLTWLRFLSLFQDFFGIPFFLVVWAYANCRHYMDGFVLLLLAGKLLVTKSSRFQWPILRRAPGEWQMFNQNEQWNLCS